MWPVRKGCLIVGLRGSHLALYLCLWGSDFCRSCLFLVHVIVVPCSGACPFTRVLIESGGVRGTNVLPHRMHDGFRYPGCTSETPCGQLRVQIRGAGGCCRWCHLPARDRFRFPLTHSYYRSMKILPNSRRLGCGFVSGSGSLSSQEPMRSASREDSETAFSRKQVRRRPV